MPYKDPEKQKTYQAAYHRDYAARYPEKLKDRSRKWQAAHPERVKAHKAASRARHREEIKAYNATYQVTNREEINARKRARYAARPEEGRAYAAAWRAANPEKQKARAAVSRKNHQEARRLAQARRQARKKGLPATLTAEQWQAILAVYKHRCAYCGKKESKKRPLTMDHVIPIRKGGGTTSNNIVPACQPCNGSKHANLPTNPVKLVLL